jgi:uncharacterized membrane protein YeaQ/YmgE (transglycosylase-associated protein family)
VTSQKSSRTRRTPGASGFFLVRLIGAITIRRWMLGVERWAFSASEFHHCILSQIEKSLVNCESPGHTRPLSGGKRRRKIMLHLIWYIVVGLIAGVIAKSVMHVHMTIFWTIVLGIIGSIIGGAVTHMFSRPVTGRFHPAGLIFSTLGAILVLYICIKLNIRFPRVL